MTAFHRCEVTDLIPFEASSSRVRTPEGFLIAPANIARTGIQLYRARELGIKDGDPNRLIRVYRPANEVFALEAMKSFESKSLADDHPPDDITAENWDKYAVGDVNNIAQNGTYLGAKVVVKKKAAIDKVDDGKVELSCGYSFDADMTPGKTPEGQDYEIVQRNIRGNHVAIVDMGRAGPGCRVADRDPERDPNNATTGALNMSDTTFSTIRINGVTLRVLATDAQAALDAYDRHEVAMKDMTKSCTDAKAAYDSIAKERDLHKERADAAETKLGKMTEDMKVMGQDAATKQKAHDAAIKEFEGKIPTGDQIEALVAERGDVVAGAKKLVGDSGLKTKGKTVAIIRSEAVAHIVAKDAALKPIAEAILGSIALDKADEGKVRDTFAALVAAKGAVRASDDAGNREVGRILAFDDGNGNGGNDDSNGGRRNAMDGMTPEEIFRYRETHGGRAPGEAQA